MSISPQIHNAAFREMGVDAVYLAFRVDHEGLEDVVEGLRIMARGFNVTIPHKTRISLLVDDLTREAHISGAVNTVRNDGGELVGHNTDCLAALDLLDKLGVRGGTAAIVGAGGAAKSVIYALWMRGFTRLYIHNRNRRRASALASGVKTIYGFDAVGLPLDSTALAESMRRADVLINATPLGMYGGELQVPGDALREDIAVMDLAYAPGGTRLQRAARERGIRMASGLEFLVLQAAYAIEFWTGRRPPMKSMMDAAREALTVR